MEMHHGGIAHRRMGLALATATLLTAAVTGCAGSAVETMPSAAPAPEIDCPADATVTLWALQLTEVQRVVDANEMDAFAAQCPGVEFEVEYYTSANLKQKLTAALAAGNAPTMFVTTGPEVSYYAGEDGENLVDLTDTLTKYEPEWESKMIPSSLAAQTIDGALYGFPAFIPGPLLLLYNTAVFDEVGVEAPATLDDLVDVSEAMQAAGKIPVSIGNQDKYPGTYWLQYLVDRAGGGDVLQPILDGETGAWSAPEIKQGLEDLRDLAEEGLFGTGFDTTGSANGADKALFYSGAAGMYMNGVWSLGSINEADPTFMADDKLGFVAFPSGDNPADESVYGNPSQVFSVTASSSPEQQEAAIAFLATRLTTEEYGEARIGTGNVPAVVGMDGKFPSDNMGRAVEYAYDVTLDNADSFNANWFNALGANGGTFADNVAAVMNGSLTPDEFIDRMNATL